MSVLDNTAELADKRNAFLQAIDDLVGDLSDVRSSLWVLATSEKSDADGTATTRDILKVNDSMKAFERAKTAWSQEEIRAEAIADVLRLLKERQDAQ